MPKLNIVFFASLKESIGLDQLETDITRPLTIGELKQQLSTQLTNGQALLTDGIQSSIDFEFSRDTDTVSESVKEVAFFPPVTGG